MRRSYILFPENFGKDMSLDETCLSNGEVYTILTNKAAHGGKGALAAMVRGVSSDKVSFILKKVPHRLRRMVKTIKRGLRYCHRQSAVFRIEKSQFLRIIKGKFAE